MNLKATADLMVEEPKYIDADFLIYNLLIPVTAKIAWPFWWYLSNKSNIK